MPTPVIKLNIFNVICLTTEDYEQVMRELTARALSGDLTLADKVLGRIMLDNEDRYLNLKKRYLPTAE